MKVQDVIEVLNGRVVNDSGCCDVVVEHAFASDLMSDVLTVDKEKVVLLTGLVNKQVIRTAEMADVEIVVIVRNKKVSEDIIEVARETGIILVECRCSMFEASGRLFANGLKPVY